MPFPTVGLSIAAVSVIPYLVASNKRTALNDLEKCERLSQTSSAGYYWLRGSLESNDAIKIDINDGSLRLQRNFGIMRYEIDRIIESRHIVKQKTIDYSPHNTERKEGEQQTKYKEEKYSKWIKSTENMHRTPHQYASSLHINGININAFRGLFELKHQYELFSTSTSLNNAPSDKQDGNSVNINVNVNSSNTNSASSDSLGEHERKTIGYKHKWYGVNTGDTYTVIGYWNGNGFILGNKTNMVSTETYNDIIERRRSQILLLRILTISGLFMGSIVGISEMGYYTWLLKAAK